MKKKEEKENKKQKGSGRNHGSKQSLSSTPNPFFPIFEICEIGNSSKRDSSLHKAMMMIHPLKSISPISLSLSLSLSLSHPSLCLSVSVSVSGWGVVPRGQLHFIKKDSAQDARLG
jgi:hypothetical protein